MIYVDTSVVLAQLLAEDRTAPNSFWEKELISSRLIEYEVWNRLHSRRLEPSHGEGAHALLNRIAFLELAPPVLARALEPFPVPVRTLDALHLASLYFLSERDPSVVLATYDERMATAARKLKFRVTAP
jgi:predicted nucleic acid-binding protein